MTTGLIFGFVHHAAEYELESTKKKKAMANWP